MCLMIKEKVRTQMSFYIKKVGKILGMPLITVSFKKTLFINIFLENSLDGDNKLNRLSGVIEAYGD